MKRMERIIIALVVIAAVIAYFIFRGTPGADVAEGVVQDSVASSDGVMIHYSVQGSGSPALVFVHGWGCDRGYWVNQVNHFADQYLVVSIDLAGHGASGLNREQWTIQAFGEDVEAVVKKLELENAVLVGHSMGGPINVEAAVRLPGKVIGLVGADNFQSFTWDITDEQIEGYLAPFRENFAEAANKWVRTMFPATADSILVDKIAADLASGPPEVGIGILDNMLRLNQAEAVKALDVPIIAINTDMWETDLEGNREICPSFEVMMMPGHGHFIHLEDPETFNALLSQAVTKLLTTAQGG